MEAVHDPDVVALVARFIAVGHPRYPSPPRIKILIRSPVDVRVASSLGRARWRRSILAFQFTPTSLSPR